VAPEKYLWRIKSFWTFKCQASPFLTLAKKPQISMEKSRRGDKENAMKFQHFFGARFAGPVFTNEYFVKLGFYGI